MQIGFKIPLSLDGLSKWAVLKHPLICRRDHEISGSGSRSERSGQFQAVERRRLPQSVCASVLVCHLQFKHRNTAAIFVWLPSAAPRTREPSMNSWFEVSSSARGVSPSHQFLPDYGDRSPRAGLRARFVTDEGEQGNFEMTGKIAGASKPRTAIGSTTPLRHTNPMQVGGIRPSG